MKIVSYRKALNGVKYAPDFGGNREASEEDKGYVILKPMDNQSFTKFKGLVRLKPDKRNGIETNDAEIQRRMAIEHITGFINMTLVLRYDDGREEEKSEYTVEEFYDFAPPALVEDVLLAIKDQSHLDEGKKTD